MQWDTVVIGSGAGGLTAAVALARAGQKVIVLEQHYLPGGWTHSFTLDGYRFSPGVHYIGDLDPGGSVRRIYEGLGLGRDLAFCELNPDGFDHFLIAGKRFDQPKGFDAWMKRLHSWFPAEKAGIDRYFNTLRQIEADLKKCEKLLNFPKVAMIPLKAPSLIRWGLQTLDKLLDTCVIDPLLRAVLSAQTGNNGLGPSRVSLPIHATMSGHYYNGAFYPQGGAKSIPRACIKELRRKGGEIRVRARVERILVEAGRAVGVELSDGERIRAGNVVCNADPAVVYGGLLPEKYCRKEIRKARKMTYSVSALSVFAAVDMDLRGMGYDSGNYWWYRTTDVNKHYTDMETALPHQDVDAMFLTITTLKDPRHQKNGHHTLEVFTYVPYAPFERWQNTTLGERGDDYERFKQTLADKLIDTAENIIPGIRKNIKFSCVGTPLTNKFYCESYRGSALGTAKTPWQLGPFSFGGTGPVAHLFLCGASTLSHGVSGASVSGLMAAQRVLGADDIEELLGPADGSLRIYPADFPEEWLKKAA